MTTNPHSPKCNVCFTPNVTFVRESGKDVYEYVRGSGQPGNTGRAPRWAPCHIYRCAVHGEFEHDPLLT